MLTVHNDVDGDLAGGRVGAAHGQRPNHRLLCRGQLGETVQRQRPGQAGHIDVVGDDYQLDVGVGELAGPEGLEAVAAEDNPDHVRRDFFAAHHLEGVYWSTGHVVPPLHS